MPRLIAFTTSFFWMCAFALLALSSSGVIDMQGQGLSAYFSVTGREAGSVGMFTSIVLTAGYSGVSAAFLWVFATVLLDDRTSLINVDEVARIAFAAGIMVLAVTMILLATAGIPGMLTIVALMTGALAASAGAITGERRVQEITGYLDETSRIASRMALSAAHNTMLSRISGRNGEKR